MDKRILSFFYFVYFFDVLENVFVLLLDDDYELVMKRVKDFLDFELEE